MGLLMSSAEHGRSYGCWLAESGWAGTGTRDAQRRPEGSPPCGRASAPQPCIRRTAWVRTHDADVRIGGELRGGGPILNRGARAMFRVGLPPPRIVAGDPSAAPAGTWCFGLPLDGVQV